jgi:anti-sigma factor RsiW
MKDAWNDIMSPVPEPDPEKLIAYLEGKLGPEERHEVERMLGDAGFNEEALEGLSMVKDPSQLAAITAQLDEQLRQKLRKKKKERTKRRAGFRVSLPVVLTVSLLILVVLAYIVLRLYGHK